MGLFKQLQGIRQMGAGVQHGSARTDQGPGIADIALAMSEGYSTAPDEVRSLGFGAGMGLPNMKKYSDEFDIQSTVGVGTTVTMAVSTV